MLKFNNVSIARGDTHILENINLTVDAESKIAICGSSGSGKSSLLMAVMEWLKKQDSIYEFKNKTIYKLGAGG